MRREGRLEEAGFAWLVMEVGVGIGLVKEVGGGGEVKVGGKRGEGGGKESGVEARPGRLPLLAEGVGR